MLQIQIQRLALPVAALRSNFLYGVPNVLKTWLLECFEFSRRCSERSKDLATNCFEFSLLFRTFNRPDNELFYWDSSFERCVLGPCYAPRLRYKIVSTVSDNSGWYQSHVLHCRSRWMEQVAWMECGWKVSSLSNSYCK